MLKSFTFLNLHSKVMWLRYRYHKVINSWLFWSYKKIDRNDVHLENAIYFYQNRKWCVVRSKLVRSAYYVKGKEIHTIPFKINIRCITCVCNEHILTAHRSCPTKYFWKHSYVYRLVAHIFTLLLAPKLVNYSLVLKKNVVDFGILPNV